MSPRSAKQGSDVGRSSFRVSVIDERRAGTCSRTLVCSLFPALLLASSAPGTLKEVNTAAACCSPSFSILFSLPCISLSFLLFLIFHPVTLQPPSYPRLVATSSETPFLRKTRSSTGIAGRLKGQFRNFHSMASRSSLFSSRGVSPQTEPCLYQPFRLRTAVTDNRNYFEIPSACHTITMTCVHSRALKKTRKSARC